MKGQRSIFRNGLHFLQKSKHPLVDFLVDKSQGWVAGLVLFLEWAMKKEEAPYLDKGEMLGTVFDYLAKEVMNEFSPSEQEILMRISFFSQDDGNHGRTINEERGGRKNPQRFAS